LVNTVPAGTPRLVAFGYAPGGGGGVVVGGGGGVVGAGVVVGGSVLLGLVVVGTTLGEAVALAEGVPVGLGAGGVASAETQVRSHVFCADVRLG